MSNAQEHLEKAIQIHPEFADAHYELALILKDKKDNERSKEHFLKTIEIRPEFPVAHFNYALLLKDMKDHKASQEHFLKALTWTSILPMHIIISDCSWLIWRILKKPKTTLRKPLILIRTILWHTIIWQNYS